ncbi:MAG: methionyl-tRNA formyltransferase [Bacteroidales bacterium]|jgi:methionyl-tRNA formyltransferase|nr:methionyl-tRNA formyltransferase [Bacteroidales bacterium]
MNPKDARIIFMGTPEFAVETLRALVENKYNVVAVITVPDKPAGRGQKLRTSAVKEYALEQNLPVLQPEKLKDEGFLAELKAYEADLQIVVAFRMLPEAVWMMPKLKTFNLHASLLPNYRGAAPINWALINGDEKSGVTTFFIQHAIDTGNIIAQKEVAITPNMNIGELYEQLMHLGGQLVASSVDAIVEGRVVPLKQDENLPMRPAPKIFKGDCQINWNRQATQVHNLVRGLSPYPAAWSRIKNSEKEVSVKVYRTVVGEECNAPSGTIKTTKSQLFVASTSHWIEILELQMAGKRRMNTADVLRGYNFEGFTFV